MKYYKVLSNFISVLVLTMLWSGFVFGQTNTFPNRGSVGIGEIKPMASLHVRNDLHITANPSAWNIAAGKGIYLRYSINSRQDEAYIQSIDRRTQRPFPMVIEASKVFFKGGPVGIGTMSPRFTLDVRGTIGSNTTRFHSDMRWKQNVSPISQALEKVAGLRGVHFQWRVNEFPDMAFEEGANIGFIAQEVEGVIPELVDTAKDGYKSVQYANMIPLLVEAIKELKQDNEALQEKLARLEAKVK